MQTVFLFTENAVTLCTREADARPLHPSYTTTIFRNLQNIHCLFPGKPHIFHKGINGMPNAFFASESSAGTPESNGFFAFSSLWRAAIFKPDFSPLQSEYKKSLQTPVILSLSAGGYPKIQNLRSIARLLTAHQKTGAYTHIPHSRQTLPTAPSSREA